MIERKPLWVAPPRVQDPLRFGGAERYATWLREALDARDLLDAAGTPLAVKARQGGPNLRCADGVSAEWVAACGRSRLRWWRHVAQERKALRMARRVIAIAPQVAADLQRWYGVASTVVLNPLLSVPPPAQPRRGAVFVGHAFHRKGLDRAIAARPPGMSLTVVGVGRQRPAPGVRYLGPADAMPFIASAEILLHPARYEPYGNVVAEAVACGTPAVVSDGTGAACLLDPHHVWAQSTGLAGLRQTIEGVLRAPRPPRRTPPSADAHLDAILAALA